MTTLSGGSSQQKNAAADGIRSERTTANDSEVLGQQSMGSTTVTQAYANVLDNQHLFGSSYGGGMDSERSTLLDAYGVALNFFKDQTASYLWPAGTSQHAYAEHRKAIDEAILTGDVWELYKHEPTFEDLHDFRRFERMREAEAIQRAARGTNQRARRNLLPMRPSIAEGMLVHIVYIYLLFIYLFLCCIPLFILIYWGKKKTGICLSTWDHHIYDAIVIFFLLSLNSPAMGNWVTNIPTNILSRPRSKKPKEKPLRIYETIGAGNAAAVPARGP